MNMRRYPIRKSTTENMVEAVVWNCSEQGCNGWMRQQFTLEKQPECPHCGSSMSLDKKLVPSLNDPLP
ncbi:cold-inducible protein YdjO-related protein [Paenibacillus enshidis]|uniref:Cold-inducible protein YdjO-related protein n=1 Tax=Paenibacillus enshidis TaxID=1458439 RepID=A0ABV5AXA8_9BACL